MTQVTMKQAYMHEKYFLFMPIGKINEKLFYIVQTGHDSYYNNKLAIDLEITSLKPSERFFL